MSQLTPRELEVLRTLFERSQKEAAVALGIAPATLKTHLASAYSKLGVGRLPEAYRKLGWLAMPVTEQRVRELEARVKELESWRDQARGALRFVAAFAGLATGLLLYAVGRVV